MKSMENRRSYEGKENPFFGKTHSNETKEKMSKPKSEEGKANIRAARLAYSESLKISKVCPQCRGEFKILPYEIKKVYCSRSCWLKYQTIHKLNMSVEARNRSAIDIIKKSFADQRINILQSLSFVTDVLSGVYIFINIENNMFYIGSSNDIEGRWKEHLNKLYGNRHENDKLQNAWNKYGEKAFEFKILEAVEPLLLEEKEQYYLDLYKPFKRNIGYNIYPKAFSPQGNKWTEEQKANLCLVRQKQYETQSGPMTGKKHSPEAREAMRKAHQERYAKLREEGKLPPQTGYEHTQEARRKMVEAALLRKKALDK